MSRETRVELTNMCMLCDGEGRVLVQDKLHPYWPGLTFPGGHVEPGGEHHRLRHPRGRSGVEV